MAKNVFLLWIFPTPDRELANFHHFRNEEQ